MKWVLVLIVIANGEVHTDYIGHYESMTDCFVERELLAFDAGGEEGYFPPGIQGICINTPKDELKQ